MASAVHRVQPDRVDRAGHQGGAGEAEQVAQHQQTVGERRGRAVAVDVEHGANGEALGEDAEVGAVMEALPGDHEVAVATGGDGGVVLVGRGEGVDPELGSYRETVGR